MRRWLLGRPPVREDQLSALHRNPGPGVPYAQRGRASGGAQFDLHARVRGARDGVECVVDQIADDGDQSSRVDQPVWQQGPVRDPQGHPALGRDRGLADQQGGEQRIVDLLGRLLRGDPVVADHLADELHCVVVHLQLQQPQDRVHPVGVLVVLGTQGVDQTARGVEFAPELLQFGAVAQGGHGAAVVGGHAVGDQDALTAHGQQIRAADPAGQHIGRTARPEHVVERLPDGLRVEPEQAVRLVVEEAYAAGAVQGDDALPDAVQHCLALREQRRDIGEGQVAGLPLDPPGEQIRGERTDGQCPARVREESRDRMDQPGPHTVVLDAHRDRADDAPFGVAQRHLAAGRAPQRATADLHDVLAGQGLAGVGRDDLADLRGVLVRPAHPVHVHHHDVLGPAGLADAFRGDLYGAVHGRQGRLQVLGDLRLGRRGLRDRERAAHGLVVELGAERGQEQPRREHGDTGGYRHLHQQYLREHPPRQTEAQSSCGGSGAHTHDRTGEGAPRRGECGVDLLSAVWGSCGHWGAGVAAQRSWSAGYG